MEQQKTIKVLIVEDDHLIAKRYQMILSKDKELEYVGHASSGYEGTMLAALQKPAINLMDVELEDKQEGDVSDEDLLKCYGHVKVNG